MTKKRVALIVVLPLAIAVTVGVLVILPPSPGVMKEQFDLIEEEMTREEVEQILGRKGGLF